ncbi:uncharacterized protein LOC110842852 [Folsomia candida]|uniref:Uncharacterized protein n=1 Tax=Folsomia candida TaxID=158441 RepID=A0A226EPT9_FOLCA|nr:uncharacterized protein LOC110842852 [Folsomia candida]OXA59300.1 hypothetical protein Fcan01_04794 [Folsomia candida]
MALSPSSKETQTVPESAEEKPFVDKNKSFLQQKYESFWLYPESHPWRLAQHITLRGVFAGATLALVGAVPFAIARRRGRILASVGKIAFRGAAVGGVLMGLTAAERHYSLEKVGIEDRAYRISYNWGQTKWDYIALDGALLAGFLLRKPFGGVLPAASVGIGLATLACAEVMLYNQFLKRKTE